MAKYLISVELDVAEDIDTTVLRELAEQVMAGEEVAAQTALNILVTGDDQIRQMNREFLGIDEPTDVLSFPDEADDFVQGVATDVLLGDIAISLPTATRQASVNAIPVELELSHLLVHGILHLCGWDHGESEESGTRMRTREERYVPGVKHSAPH